MAQGADSKLSAGNPKRKRPNCHRKRNSRNSVGQSTKREGAQGIRCEKQTEWRRGAFSLLQSCRGNCSTVAVVISLEVKFPVNPVSLRDGGLRWTGLSVVLGLWIPVFLQNTATDAFTYTSTPGPFGGRGYTPRWGPMAGSAAWCTPYIRCSPFFPAQSQPTELPATTEERWRRRHLSQGHRAGPLAVF